MKILEQACERRHVVIFASENTRHDILCMIRIICCGNINIFWWIDVCKQRKEVNVFLQRVNVVV